jgi:signal transduction histidine kinase
MQRTNFLLACFFICTNSFAQQYPFVHYTPKDGLVNSRVKKAYQDSKGRMYFLTYGGLSVYDGARFRNYTTENGLPMDIVNDILEIGNDSLLIATNSANLSLLVNGKIEPYIIINGAAPLVNQFYRHDDGLIYLSSDHGFYRLEKNKIEVLNISAVTGNTFDQPNLGNISGNGNFLVLAINEMSSNKGLYIYDIKNNRICDALTNITAHLIGKDEKKRIWFSTTQRLLIADNEALKKGKLVLIPPDKGYRQTENYSTINIAFGKNIAWFVFRNKELRNSELRRITEDSSLFRVSLPEQTTASYIKNIFIDRENNIWLSNDGEGVFKIVRSPLQIIEKPFGSAADDLTGSVHYDNGITWYSTVSKKLFRRSSAGTEYVTSNLEWAPTIFYSKEKKLLCNNSNSVYEANITNQTSEIHFQKIITLNDSDFFSGNLIVDPNGAIIAGQKSGLGVWKNSHLIFYRPIERMEKIEDLFIDKSKRLWVINRSLGIDVFSIHPENIANYLQLLFQIPAEQLPGSVRSFVMDKKRLIWIGTRDKGLTVYKQKGNSLEKIFNFHTGNGLSDNFVTSLSCDSLNNIIAGTQTGLDLVLYSNDNSYKIENLSRNNNFFAYINDTWADDTHSYALTNSGVILQVTSTAKEEFAATPQLLLEEIKINGKTILQQQTSFSYKENNLSLFVAAPSYIDEKQISYSYLLEGSGNKLWSDTSSANSIINLTNLAAGTYKLKVKAFFPSFIYSPAGLEYSFVITPPWWQTWWFSFVAGLVLIGFLISGFRFYYRRKLERQMAVLEKQQAIEKERTRIATDMHDDLGAGLSRIKFLSETIGIKKQQQEPFEDDITKIREYSHEMIDKMGEIVWALNEKNDSISDLLSYTRSYVVEYLSQNGIKCRVETPDKFPAGFVSGEFRRNIYLTVKEALHNVVKHAQASEVIIKIEINHHLNIEIKDDGTGFDKSGIRPFSNGLSNMESRIKEIGGLFELINENGTLIRIKVPLTG